MHPAHNSMVHINLEAWFVFPGPSEAFHSIAHSTVPWCVHSFLQRSVEGKVHTWGSRYFSTRSWCGMIFGNHATNFPEYLGQGCKWKPAISMSSYWKVMCHTNAFDRYAFTMMKHVYSYVFVWLKANKIPGTTKFNCYLCLGVVLKGQGCLYKQLFYSAKCFSSNLHNVVTPALSCRNLWKKE